YNIAVLQIDDPESPFPSGLPLGDASAMEEGDPAYGLDFGSAPAGQGRIPQALKTRIAALKAVTRDKNMFELEPGFQPEHDGGPLLDRRGKVIGIV
ncbi:MAG: hypothetical protein GWM98_11740, partial [Nitrospinaceae bacterium]|nr:trypsin-like peptidase domain-containing protein [Nitrospinaceae bacterium]NIS85459.1 trypsin-like peptidase domain-containing protein [Nitrospinaceae bacterium]NIT82293.1 trypsin-like peptidase domain-containing protein [Nitrospinaceae bacterium]NIU96663.1 hypothetical protein [Nitrospinaceae bacterium]NIY15512.1 hypothetical protein [Nitrospinaceae bacterium]